MSQYNYTALYKPATAQIIRASSFVGAALSYTIYLNSRDIGQLKNGRSMTVSTSQKQNILQVAGGPTLWFNIENGGHATIKIMPGKIVPLSGVLEYTPPLKVGEDEIVVEICHVLSVKRESLQYDYGYKQTTNYSKYPLVLKRPQFGMTKIYHHCKICGQLLKLSIESKDHMRGRLKIPRIAAGASLLLTLLVFIVPGLIQLLPFLVTVILVVALGVSVFFIYLFVDSEEKSHGIALSAADSGSHFVDSAPLAIPGQHTKRGLWEKLLYVLGRHEVQVPNSTKSSNLDSI